MTTALNLTKYFFISIVVGIILIYCFYADIQDVKNSLSAKTVTSITLKPKSGSVVSESPGTVKPTAVLVVTEPPRIDLLSCHLPDVDPWDSVDKKYFGSPPAKKKECNPKPVLSNLENGVLTVVANDSKTTCAYRCLNYKDDDSSTLGKWYPCNMSGATRVRCDWIEVTCGNGKVDYQQVHSQIFTPKNVTSEQSRYNVYILGLDAISHGEFHRTMPKTAYFIENEMEGINFKHLSKVGYNSVPNQMAALFGQRFTSMPHSPPGYPRFNISNPYYCKNSHTKDEQFIGFIYNDNGYRTAHIDDMVPLVQRYPNCAGFGFTHTNHSTVPLSVQMKDKEFRKSVLSDSCREEFQVSVEFFETYIKAQTPENKFAYTMLTGPGHNGINDPYQHDDYFYNWLRSIRNDLDDSFLFVWSDHGHHFGDYFYTDRGQTDTRNAMLTVILPKALRENPAHTLVQNLRKNAQTLVSQYDIFPTLVDLATANFNDPASFSTHLTLKDLQKLNKRIHEVHGDSLLRPLTHRTPTCAGLGIPFTFCLCRWPLFTPPDTSQLKEIVINKLPTLLNGYIETIGATKKCMKLAVDPKRNINVDEVAVKLPTKTSRMIRTQFSIAGHNDNARYHMEIYFELTEKGDLEFSGRVYRLDFTWRYGSCLVNEYDQNFCICKKE